MTAFAFLGAMPNDPAVSGDYGVTGGDSGPGGGDGTGPAGSGPAKSGDHNGDD